MHGFCRFHRFLHFGMALETERALVLYQHPLKIAGMGGMAIEALALRERRMNIIAGNLFHELAVALSAEFRPRGLEQFTLIRAVGLMA